MRILTLTNLYPPFYVGGYELRCAAITEALRQRGHEVLVLTSNHGLDANPGPEQHQSHVRRDLRIHGYYGHPWLGLSQLQHLELHNNQTLRAAIADFQPDVVHVWCMNGLSKSLCLTLQQLGCMVGRWKLSISFMMRIRIKRFILQNNGLALQLISPETLAGTLNI